MNFKRFVIAWRRFLRNANVQTGEDIPAPCLFIEMNKEVRMPRGDGTGPTGTVPIGGKKSGGGQGQGAGQGQGRSQNQGGGRGKMGGSGLGIGGDCTCPQCEPRHLTNGVNLVCSRNVLNAGLR